jgi:hypothetical protein
VNANTMINANTNANTNANNNVGKCECFDRKKFVKKLLRNVDDVFVVFNDGKIVNNILTVN